MDKPLVSVLMTSYNREQYISQAIESTLNSTYQNFELIIVDDGSTDKTVEIANSYVAKDSRVKLYQNKINLGDYPNRNEAARHASGKYLKYLDSDDYIYPWGLEQLVNMMEQFPDAGWGLCSLLQFTERPFPFMLSPKEAYEYNYLGPGLFHKAPLSSIIKNETFKKVGGFASIRMAGDFEMWHKLGQIYNVVLMPDGMVWYREHAQQELRDFSKFVAVYEKIKIDYLLTGSCPLDLDTVRLIFNKTRSSLRRNILKGLISANRSLIKNSLISLQQYKSVKG